MKSTGTTTLLNLKKEAEATLGHALLQTSAAVFVASVLLLTFSVERTLPLLNKLPLWQAVMLPCVLWTIVALPLFLSLQKSLVDHYVFVLKNSNLLLNLLDNQNDSDFRKLVADFLSSYSRMAVDCGFSPHPLYWRLLHSGFLGGLIFFWMYFIYLSWSFANGLSLRLVLETESLLRAGGSAMLCTIVWVCIDQPRVAALKIALADSLLRYKS